MSGDPSEESAYGVSTMSNRLDECTDVRFSYGGRRRVGLELSGCKRDGAG